MTTVPAAWSCFRGVAIVSDGMVRMGVSVIADKVMFLNVNVKISMQVAGVKVELM